MDNELYIELKDTQWQFDYIDHDRNIARAIVYDDNGTIDDFSILGAHVSGHGGEYTNISNMWFHANGALFPLISVFIYLDFYRGKLKNSVKYIKRDRFYMK